MKRFGLTREIWKALKEVFNEVFLKEPEGKEEKKGVFMYFLENVTVPLEKRAEHTVKLRIIGEDEEKVKEAVDKVYKTLTMKDPFEVDNFEVFLNSGNGYGIMIKEGGRIKTTLLLKYKIKGKEV